MIAYHECGHIIVSWFHQYSDLILKVSLLSRTKMNAFSQYLPNDRKIFSKEELFDQMVLYFGGRAAETLIFNHNSTNSEQDLKKITKLAYAQIESFGMSDHIGNMSFPTQDEEKETEGIIREKPYSKKLRAEIDMEVNRLVARAHKQAMETMSANLDKLHLLADELLKNESLKYEDIVKLIGPPLNKTRYEMAKTSESTTSDIN
jgi:ATP-dependent Zn protease